jgi:hypothetical protein
VIDACEAATGFRELAKSLCSNNFDCFCLAILYPFWDNGMGRDRMNPAVVPIDNQQGYSKKLRGYF